MKTRTIQIEYIKYMTNNHRHDIKILFISSCYYYKTVSSTSQMISNITDNENDIKHFLVTINDLAPKFKFKIDKNLHYSFGYTSLKHNPKLVIG